MTCRLLTYLSQRNYSYSYYKGVRSKISLILNTYEKKISNLLRWNAPCNVRLSTESYRTSSAYLKLGFVAMTSFRFLGVLCKVHNDRCDQSVSLVVWSSNNVPLWYGSFVLVIQKPTTYRHRHAEATYRRPPLLMLPSVAQQTTTTTQKRDSNSQQNNPPSAISFLLFRQDVSGTSKRCKRRTFDKNLNRGDCSAS